MIRPSCSKLIRKFKIRFFMEKVRIIDLEQRLFDLGHIDLPGDHLLQDAAVSQVSLQERTDDPAFLMDDLLVDVAFA